MTVEEFDERFSRHFPLKSIGMANQKILATKRALIAGLGGLGTVSSELLASIGIGNLRIVDFDVVEISNLPRQKLYNEVDIGKAKVDVAEERLKLRNPFISIDPQPTRIDAISSASLVENIDVVVDGLDLFRTRRILHRVAYASRVPYSFAGAVGESANLMTIIPDDKYPCLECVLGDIVDDPNQSCELRGVHPGILHLTAGIQALEATKLLLGQKPAYVGKMLFIDLESMEFESVNFKPKKDCPVCGETENTELDTGNLGEIARAHREIENHGKALITSICGRDTLIIDPKWEINWEFDKIKLQIANHWNVLVEGNNYVTFKIEDVNVSLLKSGVSTVRGSKSSKNAILLTKKIFDKIA